MQQADFETLLRTLSSTDNAARKHAEETYDGVLKQNPHWVIQGLAEVARVSASVSSAQMATILLRRVFNAKGTSFETLPAEAQATVKASLLEAFGKTTANEVRNGAASCIASLAVKLSSEKKNGWPELWPLLFQAISDGSSNPEIRASCCEIFSQVATALATTYLLTNLQQLCQAFTTCVKDPHVAVRVKAFKAVAAYCQVVDAEKHLKPFQALVPHMLESLALTLNAGDFENAKQLCSSLVTMAEQSPAVFDHDLNGLLTGMMHVASTATVQDTTRHIAIEVMLTITESHTSKVRKVPSFSKALFELLFNYLLNPPEADDDWATTPASEDDDEDESDFNVGCAGLDRLSVALRGKALYSLASTTIASNALSQSWQHRNAAIVTLTHIAEGLQNQFRSHLAEIVSTFIVPLISDHHRWVRYSAVQAIAQLCTDFGPNFQIDFHAVLLPLIVARLKDDPRIQGLAAGTLCNFLDDFDEDEEEEDDAQTLQIGPYINGLTEALVGLMTSTPHDFVKIEALAALSSVITAAGKKIEPLTDTLVPFFSGLLTLAEDNPKTQKDIREIKCLAIECVTLLASNVGHVRFAAYAEGVCNFLLQSLQSGMSTDDPRLRYILRGWTCMVQCLKELVLPYMATVVPPLLAVANVDATPEIIDSGVGDDDEEGGDDKVQVVKLCIPGKGEQRVRIKTSLIEDKDLAINILLAFTKELKGHMAPFLKQVTDTACSLLTFVALGETREAAATTLASCAESYAQSNPELLASYANYVIPQLMVQAKEESETGVASELIKSFSKILTTVPNGALDPMHFPVITMVLQQLLEESLRRKNEAAEAVDEVESEDENELERLEGEEEDESFLLSEVLDAISALVKTTPGFMSTFVAIFLPLVDKLLAPELGADEHRTGLCLLCDFVEHGAVASVPHIPKIAGFAAQYFADEDETVLQAAFFLSKVVIESCVKALNNPTAAAANPFGQTATIQQQQVVIFAHHVAASATQYLTSEKAGKDDHEDCTANVISAGLAVLDLLHAHIAEGAPALFVAIVSRLPCKGDEAESKIVHERLIQMMARGHPVVADPAARSQIQSKIATSKLLTDATKAALGVQ